MLSHPPGILNIQQQAGGTQLESHPTTPSQEAGTPVHPAQPARPVRPARPAGSARHRGAAPSQQAREDAFCAEVQREALRLAAGENRGFEADDIAQQVVVKFLTDKVAIMAAFPNGTEFARAATSNTGTDLWRREAVQRCQGARGKRVWLSLNIDDKEYLERLRLPAQDPAETAVGNVAAQEILDALDNDHDRSILVQRAFNNDRVGEIAADHGVNHATASRWVKAIFALLGESLTSDGYVRAS
jgi:DNA-directed RNA polymerase specialized sigma24 family protein